MQVTKVALIGMGTVGTGVARLLIDHGDRTARHAGRTLWVEAVVVSDTKKARNYELPKGVLTDDLSRVLKNPEIKLAAMLVGGVVELSFVDDVHGSLEPHPAELGGRPADEERGVEGAGAPGGVPEPGCLPGGGRLGRGPGVRGGPGCSSGRARNSSWSLRPRRSTIRWRVLLPTFVTSDPSSTTTRPHGTCRGDRRIPRRWFS